MLSKCLKEYTHYITIQENIKNKKLVKLRYRIKKKRFNSIFFIFCLENFVTIFVSLNK